MTYVYPAVFTKEEEDGYSVTFPDLEGCYTCADDLYDAIGMAEDVLSLTLAAYEENHVDIPPASPRSAISLREKDFITYIRCDTPYVCRRSQEAIEQLHVRNVKVLVKNLLCTPQEVMDLLKVPAIQQLTIRKKIAHTKEELELLFAAIENAAARHGDIDFRTAGLILRPGDIVWIGPGVSIAYEMLFEIQGLRWLYEGERYRAFISPRTRSGRLPGVEWYVPITMCETGKYHGATWNRTDMLRPENRWYGDDADITVKEIP